MLIEVEWTGHCPSLCMGRWILKIDGKDYSDLIGFEGESANTYGVYDRWFFNEKHMEEWESYTDGLKAKEWIEENLSWLKKLPVSEKEYEEIFCKFQDNDWRHNSCGGCV